MTEGVVVNDGDLITLPQQKTLLNCREGFMKYKNFPNDVNAGERILLDDGKLIFEIVSTDKNSEVVAKVIQGGELKSKKGVNLPNTKYHFRNDGKDIADAILLSDKM
jgi:pyruvate kinase